MKYIVKNCGCNPSCDECYYRCASISDCLTKRVIDRCNKDKIHKYDYKVSKDILDMFDIEEINK